jgi:hypothetical protein
MGLKKGVYFTTDAILAGGIVLTVILLISSFYSSQPSKSNVNYLSRDVTVVLSTIKVGDTKNQYIKEEIAGGSITNLDNTILEQIGEYWAAGDLDRANRTASNFTELWISNLTGIGIWINNQSVFNRGTPITRNLISTRKIISGVQYGESFGSGTRADPPTLWGPIIAEVRAWE